MMMMNQVISKTTKLYDLFYEDYEKYPGNGELSKRIVKCAIHSYLKAGMNQNVVELIKFLYGINTHTFCTHESLTKVFDYISSNDKMQNDVLDFLSTFSVELIKNGFTMEYLKDILYKSLKEFVLNGIGRFDKKIQDYLDNNHILANNEIDCLITLLFLLKTESFYITIVLTEN